MRRSLLAVGAAIPLILLSACGDAGGSVASTPAPTPSASPTPTPVPVTPTPTLTYNTAEYRASNAAVQGQAIAAYNAGATGQGVTVGVIDSGVNAASPEFAGRISSLSRDFASTRGIGDEGGHGTAVSDVLLGAKNDSGIHGVAFNATLLVLRTDTPGSCATGSMGTDQGCSHNDNTIAAALDAATAANARVVNMSLGGSPANSTLRTAISRATAAGVVIVISAGNDGLRAPMMANEVDALAAIASDPVAHGLVIVAGATDSTNALADFSNKAGTNAAYYLAALGARVQAVDQTGRSYLYSGTSFSAPVIAGAVALLAQAFPNLTGAQIVSLLYRTADDRGVAGVDAVYGNGEINLARAFAPQGSLSLGSAPVAVSLSNNATLGAAMGDAGQGSLGGIVRDEYGRDYAVDLGTTIRHSAGARRLLPALDQGGRSLSGMAGQVGMALSIDGRANPARLGLASGEARQARVLAAALAFRVSRDTALGIGIARGSDGLLASNADPAALPFLIRDDASDRAARASAAIRHRLGAGGVTLSAESGDVRLWEAAGVAARTDGYRRYGYGKIGVALDAARGPLAARIGLTRLTERGTILGSRFGSALGGGGAVSWFADARASLGTGKWHVDAALREGWTAVGSSGVRAASVLRSRSWSLSGARIDLLTSGDSFALRYVEPLRVTGGGLDLRLPGTGAQFLSLAPQGHERDVEALYTRPLARGWLTANTYWRRQPGHYATAPDELGAAVRMSWRF